MPSLTSKLSNLTFQVSLILNYSVSHEWGIYNVAKSGKISYHFNFTVTNLTVSKIFAKSRYHAPENCFHFWEMYRHIKFNVHTMMQNCWLPGYSLLKIHKLSLNLSSCITFLYNHMIFSSTLRANINTNGVRLKWWLFKDGRLRVAARIRVENVIAVLQGCFEISMYRAMWPWEDIFGYSNRMHAFFTMY